MAADSATPSLAVTSRHTWTSIRRCAVQTGVYAPDNAVFMQGDGRMALYRALAAVVLVGAVSIGCAAHGAGSTNLERQGDAEPRLIEQQRSQPRTRAPLSGEEIKRLLTEQSEKARFDGTVHGWRVASSTVLEAEGLVERDLSRGCEATLAGEELRTELDFAVSYLPTSISVAEIEGPSKWICDGEALSVQYSYRLDTPLGSGDLTIWRAVWGNRTLAIDAADDSIVEGTVGERPAILIHPAEDKYGLGTGVVIVLEDNTGPEYTLLTVSADNGVPFKEVLKIAESIR